MTETTGDFTDRGRSPGGGVVSGGLPRSGHPTRVGLFLDATVQPRWRRKVIADVAASAGCELALIILGRPAPPSVRSGGSPGRRSWLCRIYREVDRLLFRRGPDALDEVDIADLIRGCPVVEAESRAGEESFAEADVEQIRAYALDVVLCLGPEPRGSGVARVARYGAWAYRFGEADATGGEPAGIREVLAGRPATVAALHALAAGPGGEEMSLYRASLKTDRLSARRHGDHLGWVASEFVGRTLNRLRQEGSLAASSRCTAPPGQADGIPSDAEMARLLAHFGAHLTTHGLGRALYRQQWILAYSTLGAWDGPRPDLTTLRPLVPPADRFWADPFPVSVAGRTYLFFEDYPYKIGKGHISAIEIDDKGRAGEPRKVLERDYHLSYPLVFPYGGELYMIPETTANGAVELYRCAEFPGRWEYDRALIAGVRAADATLAEHDGRWWLFACIPVEGAHNDTEELHLFHAESPLGPWRPHRRNPVKSDVGSARPAGHLYRRGDIWYRPAQDCSRGYGHSMVLNRVTRWDLEGYEEVEAGRILPGWAPEIDRTHTFNALGSLFVVDARIARPRFLPERRGGEIR